VTADPDLGNTLKNKTKISKTNQMLTFNENNVKLKHFYKKNIFLPITGTLLKKIFVMPNYQSFGCVFAFNLALFRPPGSGSRWPSNADCGSRSGLGSETLPVPGTVCGIHNRLHTSSCEYCYLFLFFARFGTGEGGCYCGEPLPSG
jgi:hypothetical protein